MKWLCYCKRKIWDICIISEKGKDGENEDKILLDCKDAKCNSKLVISNINTDKIIQ